MSCLSGNRGAVGMMRPVSICGKQIEAARSRRCRDEWVRYPHLGIQDRNDGRHRHRRPLVQRISDVEFMDDVITQQQPLREHAADSLRSVHQRSEVDDQLVRGALRGQSAG